jgi:DNA-binding MarR family transcriptional regulator
MAPRARADERERAFRALMAVLGQVRGCWRDALAEHAMTLPQALTLKTLGERGTLTAGQLAEMLGVTPGNVTGILDRLEERGLAVRKPHKEDKRAVAVALTPAGKAMLARLEEASATALDEGFAHLTAAEVRQLVALLERFQAAPARADAAQRS